MGSFGRWSAYGTIGQGTRYTFFATSLLSVMLSLGVLVYGSWLYATRSQYEELIRPTMLVDIMRIMIAVSVMAVGNNTVAVYAVLKELRCLIYSFSIASVIICFMLIMGGVMGFGFRTKLVQSPLDLKLLTSLKELYGTTSEMEGVTIAWDSLQSNLNCCGVNGTENYEVWRQSKWHMHYREPKPPVPESCCLPGRTAECQQAALSPPAAVGTGGGAAALYTNTCYMPLRTDLLAVIHVAAWLCIIASVAMLVPAIFAGVYARLIKK